MTQYIFWYIWFSFDFFTGICHQSTMSCLPWMFVVLSVFKVTQSRKYTDIHNEYRTSKCFYFICLIHVYSPSLCFTELPNMDYCPPEDPNCHPWCIEYVDKCRLCRCKNGKLAFILKIIDLVLSYLYLFLNDIFAY